MKVLLTRNVNVRTTNGLVPLAKLRTGDTVISWDGHDICVDTVTDIAAAAVVEQADAVNTKNDTALVYLQHKVKIGDPASEIDVDHLGCILDTSITAWHPKQYNDIVFKVTTKTHHTLFVGDDGKILVECN